MEQNKQKKIFSQPDVDFGSNLFTGRLILAITWSLFVVATCLVIFPNLLLGNHPVSFIRINTFVLLIWVVVTFFSAMVASYSVRYLQGFRFKSQFMLKCLCFTLSVMLFVASADVFIAIFSWGAMGMLMSSLIGADRSWTEAHEAKIYCRKYFMAGTAFLAAGLILLAGYTGSSSLSDIIANLKSIPYPVLLSASLCIIIAAMIQSAMYPFQRWLLSAMTAPTPASALMHAGFVNGAGILLTLMAPLILFSDTYSILLLLGGATAVIAQFAKLLQNSVKQKLGCSTIAQMGFMLMQCGLGFFNAAVAHLILHGFYKAYLFLSSGEEVRKSAPSIAPEVRITPLQACFVLLCAVLGAVLFAFLTGKGTKLNSGLFLTLIVAVTVGQMTYNIVKQAFFKITEKLYIPLIIFVIGITAYAGIYNGVTYLMQVMPASENPQSINLVQVAFSLIFLTGFFIMKLGLYRKWTWLYVRLMKDTQPAKQTVLTYKNS